MKPFQLIYVDPPWEYRDKGNAGKRGASHKYNCLKLSDLCALPVQEIAAKDCLLALWWVPPMGDDALAVMEAWGFRLANMKGFTWRKVRLPSIPEHADRIAQAVRGQTYTERYRTIRRLLAQFKDSEHFGLGHYTRSNSEDCLFAVRGKPKVVNHNVRQIINHERLAHSHKPPEARGRLVQLMGRVPRIELFATEKSEGWQAEGLEIDGRDIRDVLPGIVQELKAREAQSGGEKV